MLLNVLLRKEVPLEEKQRQELLKLFPSELVNSINIYKGGVVPWGAPKATCGKIYYDKTSYSGKEFLTNPLSISSLTSLVHETTHQYQYKKGFLSCVKSGASSILHQFRAFLLHGSRNYAYLYPLNTDNNIFSPKGYYNPEQEAEIVEDYYYLKLLDGNESLISCYSCEDYSNKDTCYSCSSFNSKEEILQILETHYQDIMEKYQ